MYELKETKRTVGSCKGRASVRGGMESLGGANAASRWRFTYARASLLSNQASSNVTWSQEDEMVGSQRGKYAIKSLKPGRSSSSASLSTKAVSSPKPSNPSTASDPTCAPG